MIFMSNKTKQIDQKYAKETAQLNPAHRFVPWVVVNNQALQEVCD
jgi:interferon gamma-inducible protein 30